MMRLFDKIYIFQVAAVNGNAPAKDKAIYKLFLTFFLAVVHEYINLEKSIYRYGSCCATIVSSIQLQIGTKKCGQKARSEDDLCG
jgi:hypothetical protein